MPFLKKIFIIVGFFGMLPLFSQDTARVVNTGFWTSSQTWENGTVPVSSNDLVIEIANYNVLNVNKANVECDQILVSGGGELRTAPSHDLNLQVRYIEIKGPDSKMVWGGENNPYTAKTCITLTGNASDQDLVNCGGSSINKGIMVMNGGLLQLVGKNDKESWTQLGSTVNMGATSIIVDGDVKWETNDEIVIASTDFDMCHAEVRVVNTCSPINGNTQSVVTFSEPLLFSHYGEIQNFANGQETWALDERAEVGLLSRNIKIQGDANSQNTRFGGHIMIMPGMPDANCTFNGGSSVAKISNVEFYRMGQEARLGRYPIHWHWNGDSNTSFVKNSSIHESYNRAITVHGTQNVSLINNVAYDIIGHAYFLENGLETGVRIESNLGLLTKRPDPSLAILESDYFPYDSNGIRNSIKFTGPATFWISNPENIVINNHAAGSEGSGFWLVPHLGNDVPNSLLNTLDPDEEEVGHWQGNVAHSNYHGILFGGQPNNGSDVINDENGINTLNDVNLYDHTVFKNIQGAYTRCDKAKTFFYDWKIADNVEGMVGTYESYYNRCLYVGRSNNYESIACDRGEGERIWDGLVEKKRRVWGHTLYDGPSFVNDSYFVNFDLPHMSPIGNWGAAHRSFVSEFNGTSINPPNPQIHLHRRPYRDTHFIGAGIYDDSAGTFTGVPNGAIVMNDPMMVNENCHSLNESLNSKVCEQRYGHITIADFDNSKPRQQMILYRSEKNVVGPKINLGRDIALNYQQYNPIINEKYIYRVLWSDYIPDSISIRASSFQNGESTIIEFLNVPSTTSHEIQRSVSGNDICIPENDLESFLHANRTCFYKEGNSLFVKLYLTTNYHDYLNGGILPFQENFKVYFRNSVNSNVTLCDLPIWDNTNSTSPFINFDEQDWSNFDYLKVTGNLNVNALEVQFFDPKSAEYLSIGNVLNNNNDLYFTLPKQKSKRDRISGLKLISNASINLTGLKIELLNAESVSNNNLPPNLTSSVLYHSPVQNDVIDLHSLFVNPTGGNMTVTAENLPNNFSYLGGQSQVYDATNGPGEYTLTVSADNGMGGVNRQEIKIDANYIHNASFEYPDQDNSDGYLENNFTNNQENTSWSFTPSTGKGIAQKPSAFLVNIQFPAKGKQAAYFQNASNSEMCSSIYVPNGTVGLSFQAAQRGCNNQRIVLKIDGVILDTIIPPNNYFTKHFVESDLFTQGAHTICFNGLGGASLDFELEPCIDINKDHTALIDNLALMENSCQNTDSDQDGVCDAYDQCPGEDDNFSEDIDQDGIPDVCDNSIVTDVLVLTYDCDNTSIDTDNDNIPDDCDACTRPTNFEDNSFETALGNNDFLRIGATCSDETLMYLSESDWYFGRFTGISANSSVYTSQNPNAPNGNQVAFIQENGKMCQTIQIHPGAYALELMMAQRVFNGNGAPFSNQEIAVIVNGEIVDTIKATSTKYRIYGAFLELGVAGNEASCYEICFKGLTEIGMDNTVFIDAVNLIPIENCTNGDNDEICDIVDSCTESLTMLDGSFEVTEIAAASFSTSQNITSDIWDFTGLSGISSNNSGYTNQNPNAPEGNQVAFIQANGEICQTIQTNLGLYTIALLGAQRVHNNLQLPFSNQEIGIKVDGIMVDTIQPTSTSYTLYESVISLEASCHTICFQGLAESSEGFTALIDSIVIAPGGTIVNCSQNIALNSGWNLISTHCLPSDLPMDQVFNTIDSDVIQVKDLLGTYIPSFNFNDIGNWDIKSAYQINMNGGQNLLIQGSTVIPEDTPIDLGIGWNLLPYFLTEPTSPEVILEDIAANIVQVKNLTGTYIPGFGFNNIGDLKPGEGYQVKMLNADELVYQSALSGLKKETFVSGQLEQVFYTEENIAISPNNMTLLIHPMKEGNSFLSKGDEIGIFDEQGNLVGAYVYEENLSGIMIYGDDSGTSIKDGLLENETFVVRVWDQERNTEKWANLIFEQGSANFVKDEIALARFEELEATSLNSTELKYFSTVYPNPANNTITIEFNRDQSLLKDSQCKIYDSNGRVVYQTKNIDSLWKIDVSTWSNGVYFYELITKDGSGFGNFSVVH